MGKGEGGAGGGGGGREAPRPLHGPLRAHGHSRAICIGLTSSASSTATCDALGGAANHDAGGTHGGGGGSTGPLPSPSPSPPPPAVASSSPAGGPEERPQRRRSTVSGAAMLETASLECWRGERRGSSDHATRSEAGGGGASSSLGGAWPSLGGGGSSCTELTAEAYSGATRVHGPRLRAAQQAAISARHSRISRTLQRQAQTDEVCGVQAGCGRGAGGVRAGWGRAVRAVRACCR